MENHITYHTYGMSGLSMMYLPDCSRSRHLFVENESCSASLGAPGMFTKYIAIDI